MTDEDIVWQRSSAESSSKYDQSIIMKELQINMTDAIKMDHFRIDKNDFLKQNSLNRNNNNNNNNGDEKVDLDLKEKDSSLSKWILAIFCFKFNKSEPNTAPILNSDKNTNNNNNQCVKNEPSRGDNEAVFSLNDLEKETKTNELKTSPDFNYSRKLIKLDENEKQELFNDLFDWNDTSKNVDSYSADIDDYGENESINNDVTNFKFLNETQKISGNLVNQSLHVLDQRETFQTSDLVSEFKSKINESNLRDGNGKSSHDETDSN